MIAKLIKVENSEAYLEIEIAAEVFEEGLEKAYHKVIKKVDIPGFRKGSAPRAVLEANYGTEILLQDAIDQVVPPAYYAAIKDLKLDPIGEPDIEVGYVISGEPVMVKTIVPLRPEVTLGQIEGLEVTVPAVDPVKEKDVEKYLQDLCIQNRKVIEKTYEPAAIGDTVTINYQGYVEDTVFQGEENFKILLGSNTFIPGFEEQLIGVKAGDQVEVRIKFAPEHPAQTLAGKNAVFNVTVIKVENIQNRNLDDQFAREAANVNNIEELRLQVKTQLLAINSQRAVELQRQAVIAAALELCEFTVPEYLVMERAKLMLEQFTKQLASQGGNIDLYLQMTNSNEESLKREIWKDAKIHTRVSFMLDKIVAEKDFELSDDELNQGLEAFAAKIGMDTKNAKANLGPMVENVMYELKIEKAIQYLLDHAVITVAEAEKVNKGTVPLFIS